MNRLPPRFFFIVHALIGAGLATALAADTSPGLKAEDSLARLIEGNQRFFSGSVAHPDQSVERRTLLAPGPHPCAIVLACADSRHSSELNYNVGLGDLFVVRNAGYLLDDHVIASIEYAMEPILAEAVESGKDKVVATRYDLATGRVDFLG
jgi:hypothetical protein